MPPANAAPPESDSDYASTEDEQPDQIAVAHQRPPPELVPAVKDGARLDPKPRTAPKRDSPSRSKSRAGRRRRRRLHTDEVVFTDKYELPMYPEVRWKYADASDASLAKWKADHFEQHVAASKSDPQAQIDKALDGLTDAIRRAAVNALTTKPKKKKTKRAGPRRKPTYWNQELQMQQSYLTHTRRQLRQMHQMGDSFEIAEAQGALDQALDQLL